MGIMTRYCSFIVELNYLLKKIYSIIILSYFNFFCQKSPKLDAIKKIYLVRRPLTILSLFIITHLPSYLLYNRIIHSLTPPPNCTVKHENCRFTIKPNYIKRGLPWKQLLVRRQLTDNLRMDNLSNLDNIFCSNGRRLARVSNSAFNLSRCLLLGLLLVTPSFAVGFRLKQKKKKENINLIFTSDY